MNKPKISILAPSFNHQRFIGKFIESVLAQKFSDFECIIVDDCSSDGNVEEIQKYKDSRIKLITHSYNSGINAALNTAFENAKGEFIVFCAGDDMLKSNALEVIYQNFLDNPKILAIYSQMTRVDCDDKEIEELESFSLGKSRAEILHRIFMFNNCMFSPGMAMRREDFARILYPLDNAMCNHQDTQMHIKILLQGEILILKDSLVRYRFDANASNISFQDATASTRERLEIASLMDTFLELEDMGLLESIFAKEIAQTGLQPNVTAIPYFLGKMAILSDDRARRDWGYHQIMKSYNTKEKAQNLFETYGFTFKEYLSIAQSCIEDKMTKKYKKYKRAFNTALAVSVCLSFFIIVLLIKG
ncbi:MAG: glycosyltransferase [Helicobacter sp.]|uniref:glycosyltransferase family 2 protein n=1 Tax=Helicobacter sp. TaxID=218 RepID=UPI0023D5CB20|nr:glycosyltransferase [Helicobacter sp.]MDE7174550.1 glycosyltransferase [Helicobacter sp.]